MKNKDILETAKERFQSASDFWQPIFERGEDDIRFIYGEQWTEQIKAERESERRPCLTENRLLPFAHQVVNDARQARPRIRPIPVDSDADVETADIMAGMIRNIEKQSDADSAYDTAIDNAVKGGLGWLRVGTRYSDTHSFEQELTIDRIVNFASVMLAPNHKRLDGADADYGFVIDDMLLEVFEEAYPDAQASGFEDDMTVGGWASDETIRVVEYYYKESEQRVLARGLDGGVYWKDELPDGFDTLEERTVDIPIIKYCKLTGAEILEEQDVLGQYIPLVPVVGEEAFIDGRREFFSLIHQAKDPQFMLNVWKSASTEIVGLQPKAPFIGAKGQFKTYASQWAQANIKNYPFLQYDPVSNDQGMPLPPPQRQAPPTSSGSMMQEAMASAEAIKASLGMYDASAGEQTDDVSGKAIIARQTKGDNATFHFADNQVTGMKQVGRILVDLIPHIYTEQRIVKILGEDGVEQQIPINQSVAKQGKDYVPMQMGLEAYKSFMLSDGRYDVDIDVGSSYSTKRQEGANAIIELARVNPEILNITGDLLVKSLDIPMADDIAKRIQSTMNPELIGDDPEAQRMMQLAKTVEQLQQQLSETEAALQVKENDTQFNQQIKLAELELQKEKLQLDSAKAMGDLRNKQMEVEAEAFKDYAQGSSEMKEQMDDVSGAVEEILAHLEQSQATGVPVETLETVEGEPRNER